MSFQRLRATVVAIALGGAGWSAQAITLGDTNDFTDGTTQGWFVGSPAHPAPPTNSVAEGGGPDGAADPFLLLTALGDPGPGRALVAINGTEWLGDYLGASVTAITADVKNFGPTDLQLRLSMQGAAGTIASAEAVALQAGSGWQRVTFSLASADLVALNPAIAVEAVLAGVASIRLLHATSPSTTGDAITAMLGVDNITAVPEPASIWLLAAGLVTVGATSATWRARRSKIAAAPEHAAD